MNNELFGRLFWSFLFSGILAYGVFDHSQKANPDLVEKEHPRYLPALPPTLLPTLVFGLTLILIPMAGPKEVPYILLDMYFSIFLNIFVYYIFLLLLLPVLRSRFTARACATFWLIPNYLYITQQGFMALKKPLLVLTLPGNLMRWLVLLWVIGFLVVMIRGIFSHLRFRQHLMEQSWNVTDPNVLTLWEDEKKRAGMKKKYYPLMYSNAISTPLSIGLFASTTRVILPYDAKSGNPYTPKELKLIMRHEIIHIGHADSETKFFMLFCSAMLWFNPFIWKAMRHSADDLELSCDETILYGADEEERMQYANLLLRTAGDERGFTTCLSASAESLKYRLQNIMRPAKRWRGGITFFLIFFCLTMTCGQVALAYNAGTGHQYLFQSRNPSVYEIMSVNAKNSQGLSSYLVSDQDAILDYLSGLKLGHLTGNYSYSTPEHTLSVILSSPEGPVVVTLQDERVKLSHLYSNSPRNMSYYCMEPINWDYLNSLMIPTM